MASPAQRQQPSNEESEKVFALAIAGLACAAAVYAIAMAVLYLVYSLAVLVGSLLGIALLIGLFWRLRLVLACWRRRRGRDQQLELLLGEPSELGTRSRRDGNRWQR